jgi:A/G-specific adenine glycosylase
VRHPPASALLAWYDRHRRVLPFRGSLDPYRIWVSEVMLQQTTVAAVGPRFARFLARFPDVAALAAAPEAEVMEEWAGLGYYARARNLHAGARAIVARGGFPDQSEGLREIPGIGPYTAAAIAAIAFGRAVVPLDGNVERILARIFDIADPLPGAKRRLAELAQGFAQQAEAAARPGDFAQALFDLGAGICTPRSPACALCPWQAGCAARIAGTAAERPVKAAKAARRAIFGAVFILQDGAGRVLLRRRPAGGLLGGMWELPGTPWREGEAWEAAEALLHAPLPGLDWAALPGEARHGFTHRDLTLRGFAAAAPAVAAGEFRPRGEAEAILPSALRKALALAPVPPVASAS